MLNTLDIRIKENSINTGFKLLKILRKKIRTMDVHYCSCACEFFCNEKYKCLMFGGIQLNDITSIRKEFVRSCKCVDLFGNDEEN